MRRYGQRLLDHSCTSCVSYDEMTFSIDGGDAQHVGTETKNYFRHEAIAMQKCQILSTYLLVLYLIFHKMLAR